MSVPLSRLFATALMLLALPACAEPPAQILTAETPWIREAPPGAQAMAGYVVLRNRSERTIRCGRVTGPDFGAIEIHRTVVEDGQSRMLRDQVVEVPPQGIARLAPGGYHLMLFRPQRTLIAGDSTRLDFDCGSESLGIVFPIRKDR